VSREAIILSVTQKVTAETLKIAPQFKEKRLFKKKQFFDDEGADERTSDLNEQWINEVFLTAINTAQATLKEKISGQRAMLLSLSAFLPTSSSSSSYSFIRGCQTQPTTYGTKSRCRHIHGHTHTIHAG